MYLNCVNVYGLRDYKFLDYLHINQLSQIPISDFRSLFNPKEIL